MTEFPLSKSIFHDEAHSKAKAFQITKRRLGRQFKLFSIARRQEPFGRAFPEMSGACDAMHRGKKKDTHPTHGCMTLFSGFWSARSARSRFFLIQHGVYLGFCERAHSVLLRWLS